MNSVLLVGSDRFSTSVIAQVRSLDALKVMSALTVALAIERMEVSLPDVVIVQGSYLVGNSISQTFGEARSSPYYLLIAEPGRLIKAAKSEEDRYSPQVLMSNRMAYSVDHLSELYMEEKAIALESGADAYLWRLSEQSEFLQTTAAICDPHLSAAHNLDPQTLGSSLSLLPVVSFRKSQQRLIQAHIHIGLNQAQRYRDLSRINDWLSAVALVDALTQLSNRRAFDMELPRQVRVARTKSKPLSLMVIDIDCFKAVNDCHGHLVGDDVLKQLAKRLLNNMRFYDVPFRYGGEEFVVTLSNTGVDEAEMIANRLRQSIERSPFELEMLADDLKALKLTVSIGLTQLQDGDDAKGASFLHRADQNLLRAKAKGRNQAVGDRAEV